MPKKRTCWCPCCCGWTEPDAVISASGLCPDCEGGNHEVPPDNAKPSVSDLLKMHESIVAQYQHILKEREKEQE